MNYAPHILQKRLTPPTVNDEYGRPLPVAAAPQWQDICRCRCDHSGDTLITLDNGNVVYPQYHIVCDGNRPDVQVDDHIRCLRSDGTTRAEGKVSKVQTLNYLPYAEIYL